MLHPWETSVNAFNVAEPTNSNLCVYHQKFCTDEFKRHPKLSVKITIPNKHALCSECFILKEGQNPKQFSRIPGVKRNLVVDTKQSTFHRKKILQLQDTPQTHVVEENEHNLDKNYLKKVLAAKRIQFQWRIRKKQMEIELQEYEQQILLNSAALKVQGWFCALPKTNAKQDKKLPTLESKNRGASANKVELQKCYRIEHEKLNDLFINDDLFKDIKNIAYSYNLHQKESIRAKKAKISSTITTSRKKCTLGFCQICNEKPLKLQKRRRVDLIPEFHDENSMNRRKLILTNVTDFQGEDPFGIGIIRKAKFEAFLTQRYKDIGHPLPKKELKSLTKRFNCRNGFIDYESYLNIARQQSMPCFIHGRFVCTHLRCVDTFCREVTSCDTFSPSSPNSKFCKCGEYVSRHKIKPKLKMIPVTKRGQEVFSHGDMKRTFARPTNPDLFTGVKFIPFESLTNVRLTQCIAGFFTFYYSNFPHSLFAFLFFFPRTNQTISAV